ncbi:MAG: HEAT repeat domain-containing protein [Myxococcota bacterium]|nr:HEAT repeat domain-containing protein [Myxococcota bacterium]
MLILILTAFEPATTLRALKYDEARQGAIVQLFSLNQAELIAAKASAIPTQLVTIAADRTLPTAERILAIRATEHLGTNQHAVALFELMQRVETPVDIAVSREIAALLYSFGAVPLLSQVIDHPDPEVRIWAARSGSARDALCRHLNEDPWPAVRAAAAEGIAVHPDLAPCLLGGTQDASDRVQAAAIDSIGKLAYAPAKHILKKIALSPKKSRKLRGEALIALSRMGMHDISKAIIDNHLKHGGIIELTVSALHALGKEVIKSKAHDSLANSSDPRVLSTVLDLVFQYDPPAARDFLSRIRNKLSPLQLERVQLRLDALYTPKLGESINKDQ